jgi:hypothetical protein
MREGKIEKLIFAFYLPTDPKAAGELTIGWADPAYYEGPLFWTDVKSWFYWEFEFRLLVGDQVVMKTSGVPDSGTSFLIGPASQVNAVAKLVGAKQLPGFGRDHFVRCKSVSDLPELRFAVWSRFQRRTLALRGPDYLKQRGLFAMLFGYCALASNRLEMSMETWTMGTCGFSAKSSCARSSRSSTRPTGR